MWPYQVHNAIHRWRFVIHGGIDGYSRVPVFLKCSSNNRAETVQMYFEEAVQIYGVPIRVRTDKGEENFQIARYMLSLRGDGSIIMGRSIHNQRIERLWRDVFQGCLSLYYQLFYYLEDSGLLDPCSELHLFALHYVYKPRIQRSLDSFSEAYMHHPLSSCHNATPAQLFYAGLYQTEAQRGTADEIFQVS